MVLESVSVIPGDSVHQLTFLFKIHQQHADGICLSDSGLLLLHGSQGAVPGWVRVLSVHCCYETFRRPFHRLGQCIRRVRTTSYLLPLHSDPEDQRGKVVANPG